MCRRRCPTRWNVAPQMAHVVASSSATRLDVAILVAPSWIEDVRLFAGWRGAESIGTVRAGNWRQLADIRVVCGFHPSYFSN